MRREAFNFITKRIMAGKLGEKITRVEVTGYMLKTYNPDIKSPIQGSCRMAGDHIFRFYVEKGILERIGRGIYQIVALLTEPVVYEDIYRKSK